MLGYVGGYYLDLAARDTQGTGERYSTYTVSGVIANTGPEDAVEVSVTVTLYDALGRVIGTRRATAGVRRDPDRRPITVRRGIDAGRRSGGEVPRGCARTQDAHTDAQPVGALMIVAKDAPFLYRFLQRVIWIVVRVIVRPDVTGVEHVPLSGPLVVSCNHLHSLDIPAVGLVVPRWQAVFAADKWRGEVGGWIMEHATRVIYVARGEADREAMNQALAVLRAGGAVAVAPEGTRSRTGGLQQGRDGAVYLASRTGATIIPVVAWGQEQRVRSVAAPAQARDPRPHRRADPPAPRRRARPHRRAARLHR